MLGFIELCESSWFIKNNALLRPYAQYFQAQWFGQAANRENSRRGQTEHCLMFSVYTVTRDNNIQTTSLLEGWHRQFALQLNRPKSDVGKLLACIREQQELTEYALDSSCLGAEYLYLACSEYMGLKEVRAIFANGYSAKTILPYLMAISEIINKCITANKVIFFKIYYLFYFFYCLYFLFLYFLDSLSNFSLIMCSLF